MNNEAREREPDEWPGEEKTGNTLSPETRDPGATRFTHETVLEDGETAGDPSFVKAAPIAMRGAWRKAFHFNCWWVVGHHLLYPCNSERDADRMLRRLQEDWDEP